jgi:hypothetical protein
MNSTRSMVELSPLWDIRPLLYVQDLPAQLFWYLSTRMGPNLLFLFSTLQWVVTYMWLLVDEFNSPYWWNYPISLRHWSRYCTYRLFQLNYFGIFQLGWALTLVPFQHAQWVVTYMWLLVDGFNSQYWWNYPLLWHWTVIVRWALPAQLVSFN